MQVEIDSGSGFCFGVVYAIKRAEDELAKDKKLFCLGDIVHNSVEVKRLQHLGLQTIGHKEFEQLHNAKVLLRAHGEPPETYRTALKNNITLIDASCPVVLKLQKKIKEGFDLAQQQGGQVAIFGKKGHAEVVGLVGQTGYKAIVISSEADLGQIDFSRPVSIFSQTTKSPAVYQKICTRIAEQMHKARPKKPAKLTVNQTICSQVAHRDKELRDFSRKHEVIVFVSGKKSSNGKMLYEICRQVNPKSYFVSEVAEIQLSWFENCRSAGICGATSTPRWLMEKIYDKLLNIKPA